MITQLPIDVIRHIETFIFSDNFKTKCLDLKNAVYDLEICGAYSLWRNKPSWVDYKSYWDEREQIYTMCHDYIDICRFYSSHKYLCNLNYNTDFMNFIKYLDNEVKCFTSNKQALFLPILKQVTQNLLIQKNK